MSKPTTSATSDDGPIRGVLYAALETGSDKKLSFRCTEKLFHGDNLSFKANGIFQQGSAPTIRIQAKAKKALEELGTRVSGRVRYDFAKNMVKSSLYLKKRISIADKTSVNLKAEYVLKAEKGNVGANALAKMELSHKIFNITDTQDFRLRLGSAVRSEDPSDPVFYVQARENNVSLVWDSKGNWNVLYDF
mmetsp:Transcript_50470/g.161509  ORF Transcript_50470/g.161509 Transcript_50470/m.161509 type:complete len:191 (-) Transcript_50470:133-705(-)